jgi:hypothetical protein
MLNLSENITKIEVQTLLNVAIEEYRQLLDLYYNDKSNSNERSKEYAKHILNLEDDINQLQGILEGFCDN